MSDREEEGRHATMHAQGQGICGKREGRNLPPIAAKHSGNAAPPLQTPAEASKVLQRATGDSALSALMLVVVIGRSMALTPPASAATVSRASSPVWAWWAATREEEQAVSVLTQGPAEHPMRGGAVLQLGSEEAGWWNWAWGKSTRPSPGCQQIETGSSSTPVAVGRGNQEGLLVLDLGASPPTRHQDVPVTPTRCGVPIAHQDRPMPASPCRPKV